MSMPAALTSNSPGVTRGKGHNTDPHPEGVVFQLPQLNLWRFPRYNLIIGIMLTGILR